MTEHDVKLKLDHSSHPSSTTVCLQIWVKGIRRCGLGHIYADKTTWYQFITTWDARLGIFSIAHEYCKRVLQTSIAHEYCT